MAGTMAEILEALARWMQPYMRSFYNEAEDIQQAVRIKEIHTGYVRAYTRELAIHLGLTGDEVTLAEIMGLLHDVGRFYQFTVYRTFNDAISEDHAKLGLKVIAEHRLLKDLSEPDQALVTFAIANHNKKEIAPAPDDRSLLYAKILRDADKLDIYRVLEPFLEPSDGSGISPDFLEKFIEGEQVDYTRIRTLDDRKLVRLMWVYDVNYSWTLRRIVDRGYVDKIIGCLPGDGAVARGVRRLRDYVEAKCGEDDPCYGADPVS